jgi:hypothetical protein
MNPPPLEPNAPDEETVPFFGSWRAIYTAVIVCALLAIALITVFSRWPY